MGSSSPNSATRTVNPSSEQLLEPADVARWLRVDPAWVHGAIAEGLPVLGRRTDGTPILAVEDVRRWLRRSSPQDDTT
ncbi:MAG: hypothetical protein JWM31_3722 [Solirubrobacterales bacterium]|nr:hypothetical protein [Solirubrobacterales bacterium]